ncbi:MAG: hypothetical protein QW578_08215 [Thermoplasmatales archaeon]
MERVILLPSRLNRRGEMGRGKGSLLTLNWKGGIREGERGRVSSISLIKDSSSL